MVGSGSGTTAVCEGRGVAAMCGVRGEGRGYRLGEWQGNLRRRYIYNIAISGRVGCLLGHDLLKRALYNNHIQKWIYRGGC
jgi:hypothetical protein